MHRATLEKIGDFPLCLFGDDPEVLYEKIISAALGPRQRRMYVVDFKQDETSEIALVQFNTEEPIRVRLLFAPRLIGGAELHIYGEVDDCGRFFDSGGSAVFLITPEFTQSKV